MTYILYKLFLKTFPPEELKMIDMISRMFCEPVFDLDINLLIRYKKHITDVRQALINKSNISEDVLSSNVKYGQMFKDKGLKPPEKISPTTNALTYAFAKTDIAYINFQKANPGFKDIFIARKAAKSTLDISRCQRFIDIYIAAKGKMPVALRYSAAHTHRLGGTDKTNLQNLTRNAALPHPDGDLRPGLLRRSLIVPEHKTILVRDLSNIEARILAVIADQLDLVAQFREGKDPYAAMAEHIYGRPINKKDDPLERNVGKMAVLGLGYGMSGTKFKDTLNSGPLGMAPIYLSDPLMYDHIVYNVYRKLNTGITSFWKTCDRFIYWMATTNEDEPFVYKCLKVYKEKIVLPNDLALQYPNLRRTSDGWTYDTKTGDTNIYGGKLTENIVQALAQIFIKTVMLETTKQLPEWRVVLQVHDETINVGPEKDVKRADKIIEKIMGTPPTWMPDLPLNSEGGWANNYIK